MSDNRAKILDAASALFLTGGFHALSVRAIAAKAELSTIGIYSHFNGKDGILDALYIEGFNRVKDAMTIDSANISPTEAILVGCRHYIAVADQYHAHYKLIFGESSQAFQPSDTAQRAAAEAFNILISSTAIILPKQASLLEKQKNALTIWGIVHGMVGLQHHAVSAQFQGMDWQSLTLNAVKGYIDATYKDAPT